MADLMGFDANSVEPTGDLEPIPAGKYQAVVTESEMTPNKNKTGHYLKLTFQILEGPYKGRQLWSRLNLDNPNPTAMQIARAELSAICRAVGIMLPKDSQELHNLPLTITVKCKTRSDNGEIGNEIRGFDKRQEAAVTAPAATAPNNAIPPWRRT